MGGTIITVATAASADSKSWKNEQIEWSEFARRLYNPAVTRETLQEFLSMSKEDQGSIKDVGGYVAGYLNGGRRQAKNLMNRRVLTLDVDFASMDFWDKVITVLPGIEALLHGTHKHQESDPRLRLIVPLNREVLPDEYCAISRKIADYLDINLFDPTTFQPERLMFWPSIPCDQQYYLKHQQGLWLDADAVLSQYPDWRDITLWPTTSHEQVKLKDPHAKQQDPTEKNGFVGTFCRTYSISEAITQFLSDSYEPGIEGRYTYKLGSGSNGAVVYEDKWLYSHHGTDPVSMKLCNAYDLVRVHLFGHEDAGNKSETKSTFAMNALIRRDSRCKLTLTEEQGPSKQLVQEMFAQYATPSTVSQAPIDTQGVIAVEDFPKVQVEDIPEDNSWKSQLDLDSKGRVLTSDANIALILLKDPQLKNVFRHNLFERRDYVCGRTYWDAEYRGIRPVSNADLAQLRVYFGMFYGITGKDKIRDGLVRETQRLRFHPIREYLQSLEWDGIGRIETWLQDYMGAEECEYTRRVARLFFAGAVKRIMEPGCKFDYTLMLSGKQGEGKSTLLRKLAKDAWFSDSFTSFKGKEAYEQLHGHWIIELAELSALKKSEVETAKQFLTKQTDTYRPPYGETKETFHRQCVFAGTTNEDDFLKDTTGNRRFLPIASDVSKAKYDVKSSDYENIVDHLWAEAFHNYKNGEPVYFDKRLESEANRVRTQYQEEDPRKAQIEEFLSVPVPKDWYERSIDQRMDYFLNDPSVEDVKIGLVERVRVTPIEIWVECLNNPVSSLSRYESGLLRGIMNQIPGWEYDKKTFRDGGTGAHSKKGYGRNRYYHRKDQRTKDVTDSKFARVALAKAEAKQEEKIKSAKELHSALEAIEQVTPQVTQVLECPFTRYEEPTGLTGVNPEKIDYGSLPVCEETEEVEETCEGVREGYGIIFF